MGNPVLPVFLEIPGYRVILLWMADARNKFAQPDEDTPFGRHLKEVTRYLNIGIPSFTGTYNATLPEEEHWMIQVKFHEGRSRQPLSP